MSPFSLHQMNKNNRIARNAILVMSVVVITTMSVWVGVLAITLLEGVTK